MAKQFSNVEALGLIGVAVVVIIVLVATQSGRDERKAEEKQAANSAAQQSEARARDELAARHRSCRQSKACTSQGRCAAGDVADVMIAESDDGCVAVSEEDCARAGVCRALGWCSLNEGVKVCYIAAGDCARTEKCELRGMCTREVDANAVGADPFDRVCVASEADCLRPEMQEKGLKCWMGTVCVARVKGRCPKR